MKRAIATPPGQKSRYEALSLEEMQARKAEEDKINAAQPLRDWEKKMKQIDRDMPRWAEDIIDALPASTKNKISNETLEKYNDKKKKRSERPS